MIEDKGVDAVIPDKQTLKDAVNVYYRFYTKEQEEEFGVVAMTLSFL